MAATAEDISIHVKLASDRMRAELIIPSNFNRDLLTPELCHGALQEAGVEVTEVVDDAVRRIIAIEAQPDQSVTEVVAVAKPAEHGRDGFVEWLVDDTEASQATSDAVNGDDPDRKSHYDRSAFVIVHKDQVIGTIHHETAGTDGRDVTGKNLAAKDGKPLKFTTDDTILLLGGGKLVAQLDGVLERERDRAFIRQVLEVADAVDFSTGNINFAGDVNIRQGIKDCFKVRATGNVDVRGLIEAADIECGGKLTAHGGWAGRDQGHGRSGGNLEGKYLDGVTADVRGDLCIDKEVINSKITVHGGINSPHGAIIGGRVYCTKAANIGTLGSGGCVRTELVLDTVPRLDAFFAELDVLVTKYTEKRDALTEEQERITKLSRKGAMTATDKERQCEIMFEVSTIQQHLKKAELVRDALEHEIDENRTLNLLVQRKLHTGVVLDIRGCKYVIKSDVRGPVRIQRQGRKEIVYRRDDESGGLLGQIADVEL